MKQKSLQETYAPAGVCFGCGPSNPSGLHIRSFVRGEEVIAHWKPQTQYEAFAGILSGGIIGTLLDCHSNWTAAWHLMQKHKAEHLPCTVTAGYSVKLLRPTPTGDSVELIASVTSATDDSATVDAKLIAEGKVCATCSGTFVAVKPGHPAYHRW